MSPVKAASDWNRSNVPARSTFGMRRRRVICKSVCMLRISLGTPTNETDNDR